MAKKVKENAVDPRVRMKEVREDVKNAMKTMPEGMSHLGQYPQNMADARRTIIALQDMLEERTARHSKASNLVRELREADTINYTNTIIRMADLMGKIDGSAVIIKRLQAQIERVSEIHKRDLALLAEKRDDLADAYDQIEKLSSEKKALFVTLNAAMGN